MSALSTGPEPARTGIRVAGGREGLQAVQRYQQDYDGVLSQVAVMVRAHTGTTCLSDAQLAGLDLCHAPTGFPCVLEDGFNPFAGRHVGSKASNNSLCFSTSPSVGAAIAPSPMLVATVGTTSCNSLLFDPTACMSRVQNVMSTLHAASPDLSVFKARGAKLLMKSRSSDCAVTCADVAAARNAVGTRRGEAGYLPTADLSGSRGPAEWRAPRAAP